MYPRSLDFAMEEDVIRIACLLALSPLRWHDLKHHPAALLSAPV